MHFYHAIFCYSYFRLGVLGGRELKMAQKINKVVRVILSGGLIGALGTNPKAAIEKHLQANNSEGWSLVQMEQMGDSNLLMLILKLLLLVITLGLFTFGTGFYLIFEKDSSLKDMDHPRISFDPEVMGGKSG